MSVYTLLSLPETSDAFKAVIPTARLESGSASPPRKIQRLDSDSDSSSTRSLPEPTGPVTIRILGNFNPSRAPDDSADFALLRRTIVIILDRKSTSSLPATFERVYNTCRSIVCVSEKGEGLYDILKVELEKCIGRLSKELTDTVNQDDPKWIKLLVEICQWLESQVALLQSLLAYLNQLYIKKHKHLSEIKTLAFQLFTSRVFEHPIIGNELQVTTAEWLQQERTSKSISDYASQFKLLIVHLQTHGQYTSFESHYLDLTRSFYLEESNERSQVMKDDPKGFFRHVYDRINEEVARAKSVLPPGSWAAVQQETESALLEGRAEWLSSGSIRSYVESKDFKTLGDMYQVFSRVERLKSLCLAFKNFVQKSVENIVRDKANDESMIERLLAFKALAEASVNTVFLETSTASAASGSRAEKTPNKDFVYALTDAFTAGFKARRNTPAEMLAKYLDKTLRKGQGSKSDDEFDGILNTALSLYRFTDDRDVFRTFYHRQLAKRLLLQRSASDDFERQMLKKLKEGYDPELGSAEEMFSDLSLSRDLTAEHRNKRPLDSTGDKLMVYVLKSSAWPFSVQNKMTVDLPIKMQDEITRYTNFYKKKHANRDLKFDHSLGTATMTGQFKEGSKELSVSLYQAVILLLFNDANEVGFMDIKLQTRMEDEELRRTLQSLAYAPKKKPSVLLHRGERKRDISDGDVFEFNANFTDPRPRVHINTIQAKVSAEESKRTQDSIEGDRKHYLDAAIVRIMKAKKEMHYEKLKTATIDAVKGHFIPQVDAIKKRIDALVEGEYLERSAEDRNKFLYVA